MTTPAEVLIDQTVEFLKQVEGFEPVARTPKGIKGGKSTYGYGFEFKNDNKTRVTDGETITKEEAEPMLKYKVTELHNTFSERYENYRNLPLNVKSGVLSFGFNAGINVFEDPSNQTYLRPALNSGDPTKLKDAIGRFVYGPTPEQGAILKLRRMKERAIMDNEAYFDEFLYNPSDDGRNPRDASRTVGP